MEGPAGARAPSLIPCGFTARLPGPPRFSHEKAHLESWQARSHTQSVCPYHVIMQATPGG